MIWLAVLAAVSVVFSAGFLTGCAWCYGRAYTEGVQDAQEAAS